MRFHKIILVLVVVILFSGMVSGERLYTWGVAEVINLDTDENILHSYDGFDYKFKQNGTFTIWKDDVKQGRWGFGLKGVYLGSDADALSTDYEWIWTVIENTSERIEVKGERASYGNFPWEITLVAEKYAPLKITNYLENNSNNDITELEFLYYFDVETDVNPTVSYIDEFDVVQQYSYHTNQLRDDVNGLAELDFHKVTVPFFNFQFQDIIDNGYSLSYLYFGNLNALNQQLPDHNGFIVGFSEGDGIFAAHSSYEIDPTIGIYSSSTYDGYTRLDDDGYASYDIETETSLTTINKSGHDGVSGVLSRMYFGIMFFMIGADETTPIDFNVSEAKLYLDVKDSSVTDETCTFDLNSTDYGIGLSVAYDDWRTSSFGIIANDFADESTVMNDQILDITDAWNDSRQAGRGYLNFRIGIDDWNGGSYNDAAKDCWVQYIDTTDSTGTPPYIEYKILTNIDLNINAPNGGETLVGADGNFSIDFNILSENNDVNGLSVDLYYSTTQFGMENLIAADYNLLDAALNPISDFNCYWDSEGFGQSKQCVYDWDFSGVTAGNYYLDINAYVNLDNNWIVFSSATTFEIVHNTAPDINLLAPDGSQYIGGIDVNISFSAHDEDIQSAADGSLYVDIYYSTNPQEFETLIVADMNLTEAGCDDTNFMNPETNCYFAWNTDGNAITDGNYYIDLNISDDSDANAISASAADFMVDNSIPDIYIWQPQADGVDSNTLVTFDVNENSLITAATVTINGVASGDFTFATHCALFDINYHCQYVETGFVPNFDNNLSILATNTIGDTNQSDLNSVLNNAPSITIQAPAGNQYLGGDDLNISFRVTDSDLNGEFLDGLFVALAFSPTSGAFTNSIVAKLDLFTADCDSNIFSGGVNCTYEWDANAVSDGNYFLDGNVFDRYDFNAQGSGGASFFMDNSAPDISINRPTQGSMVSARQIDFNVMENGLVSTISAIINGTASTVFSQATHCTLVDINYVCSYVENAVTAGDNNITIRALNTGGGNDQNELSRTFVFNDPATGGAGGGGGVVPPPPAPAKRFEIISIPETINATRDLGTEFRIVVKNTSNDELSNFEIRFNEDIAPLINTISAPEIIGAGQIVDFVYRITPETDTENQTLVAFFFDGSFADSQEINVMVIDSAFAFAIVSLNSPVFNFGESVINWNILLFAILTVAFLVLLVTYPLPKQLISVKIITLVALGLLLVSVILGA